MVLLCSHCQLYPTPIITQFSPTATPLRTPGTLLRLVGALFFTGDTYAVVLGGLPPINASWLEVGGSNATGPPLGTPLSAVVVEIPPVLELGDYTDVALTPNRQQYSQRANRTLTVFSISGFSPRYAPIRGGSLLVIAGQNFPTAATLGGLPASMSLLVAGVSLSVPLVTMARNELVLRTPAVTLDAGVAADRLDIALRIQSHAPAQFGLDPTLSKVLFYGQ